MSSLKVASDSDVDNQLAGQDDEDSDSDSDDNFCVTIGDIRLGEAPQSVGSGHTPVNLNIQAKGRIHADGVDVSTLGDVHRDSVTALDVDLDSYEEKPWNKPGADIADYFNYGFVEETWKAYCNVQRMLRTIHESKTSSSTKIRDQKGRTGHRETGSCCDYPLSGSPGHSTTDVIGGQTGFISRVEGRQCEVLSEDKEKFSSHLSHISVPPLLSPAFNIRSASPLSPSPPFHGAPSPLLISPLSMLQYRSRTDSRLQSEGWDSPSVPLYAVSTGACPPVLTSMTYFTGLLKRAEAFQHHTQQDRKQDRNRERSRSREHGHNNVRERDRDREQRSPHNRWVSLT
ncbi:pre-mRNA 3'-end-processing factor FIP1 [Myripristis murdjan]|uniref:pre-mRNA 3'-end-processing factor FIP1 n=1 Tax=Myripristis murdjan TaxID=586833 RepID=UPI0011761101|nr:pre-mRNA 3'-end-processing factor FIP1 [Myripristis murdjan]